MKDKYKERFNKSNINFLRGLNRLIRLNIEWDFKKKSWRADKTQQKFQPFIITLVQWYIKRPFYWIKKATKINPNRYKTVNRHLKEVRL